jgi:hypothetical protein
VERGFTALDSGGLQAIDARIPEIGQIVASRVNQDANPWPGTGVR